MKLRSCVINKLDYGSDLYLYRCYDFKDNDGKYASPLFPYPYVYDEYVYVGSKYYNAAHNVIELYREMGIDVWTGKPIY